MAGGARKKLIDAARWWAGGSREVAKHATSNEDADVDLKFFGAPPAVRAAFAAARKTPPVDPYPVLPENWTAAQLFVQLQTQWRISAGFGGALHTGLDYAAVWAVLHGQRVRHPERVFADLRIMEAAALIDLNKREAATPKPPQHA